MASGSKSHEVDINLKWSFFSCDGIMFTGKDRWLWSKFRSSVQLWNYNFHEFCQTFHEFQIFTIPVNPKEVTELSRLKDRSVSSCLLQIFIKSLNTSLLRQYNFINVIKEPSG